MQVFLLFSFLLGSQFGRADANLPGPVINPVRTVERVSVGNFDDQLEGRSGSSILSGDGRFVTFSSNAPLANGGQIYNSFIRDLTTGNTILVSGTPSGESGNGDSWGTKVSRYDQSVVFYSQASNLVANDTNGVQDVFVRDLTSRRIELISVGHDGSPANGESFFADISPDGRFVVFTSDATNLVPGDINGVHDIFLRDRKLGKTRLLSLGIDGKLANGGSISSSFSADGRYVLFSSKASNLVAGDNNSHLDIFIHDLTSNITRLVSVNSLGEQANGPSFVGKISDNGRFVVFGSAGTNLAGNSAGVWQIYVRDLIKGTTEVVSVNNQREDGNQHSFTSDISANGRFIIFDSYATNLVDGNNRTRGIYVRDRLFGRTYQISIDASGVSANGDSYGVSISVDGSQAIFSSKGSNLVPDDTNGRQDVFRVLLDWGL